MMPTWRFELRVGRLVRGHVERSLRSLAFLADLQLDIESHMGLFGGVLLITVTGPAPIVKAYVEAVQEWAA